MTQINADENSPIPLSESAESAGKFRNVMADRDLFVAVDLGASNVRVMTGRLCGRRLEVDESCRFEHAPTINAGHLRWNWPVIRDAIRCGLADLPAPRSVSSCSWAQDFGLLDEAGTLIESPVSYMDERTRGMPESFGNLISPDKLVRRAGVASTNITTLCQLRAMTLQEPEKLKRAHRLAHIADLVNFDLGGRIATDWTMASAAQLCSRSTGTWDVGLLNLLGIPGAILPELVNAPVRLADIPAARAPRPDWVGTPVILAAGHDTLSAFHVLPEDELDTLFVSCGTWIMAGVRLPDPPTAGVEQHGTLLGLAGGGWGLWRGMLGLWLIQQCRRAWRAAGQDWAPEDLTVAAARSECQAVIDLSVSELTKAEDVPAAIADQCRATGEPMPVTPGDIARIITRSLAVLCCDNMRILSNARGRPFRRIRMVGGGSRDSFLCQCLADACGLPLDAGPAEASAAGNLLLQIQAMGIARDVSTLDEIRRASFALKTFLPA